MQQSGEAPAPAETGAAAETNATTAAEGQAPALDVSPTSLSGAVEGLCRSETVRAAIARTVPPGLSDEARRALQNERRLALRLALRTRALEHSLEVEQGLVPYLAVAGLPQDEASMPATCPYFEARAPETLAAVRTRHEQLSEEHRHFTTIAAELISGADGSNGLYGQLLAFTYEAVLLQFLVDGGFRDAALRPGEVSIPGYAPAPPYPLNYMTGVLAPPEERLAMVHSYLPLLKRPARRFAGVPTATLAETLFRDAFTADDARDAIAEQLRRDIAPELAELHAQHAAQDAATFHAFVRDNQYQLPDESELAGRMELPQRKALLVWQRFTRERARFLIDRRASEAMQQRPELRARVLAEVGELAASWQRELSAARHQLCRPDDEEVEHDPHILGLFLAEPQGDTVFELLDGYCNSAWGRTWATTIDAALHIGGYLLIAASVLPPAGPAPLLLSVLGRTLQLNRLAAAGGALLATAHLREGLRVWDSLDLRSALYAPALRDRWWRQAELAYDVAMVPAAIVLSGVIGERLRPRSMPFPAGEPTLGQLLRNPLAVLRNAPLGAPPATLEYNGWRIFVPQLGTLKQWIAWGVPLGMATGIQVKKYLDLGQNPLTQMGFYTDMLATHLMVLVGVNGLHAGGTSATLLQKLAGGVRDSVFGVLGFLAMDDFLQRARFMATGQVPDGRFRELVLQWVPTGSMGNMVALTASVHLVDTWFATPRVGFINNLLAQTAWKIFQGYFYYNFSYAVFSRYLVYRDLSFTETILATRPEDFLIWLDNDVCKDPQTAAEKESCESLVRDRFSGQGERGQLADLDLPALDAVQFLARRRGAVSHPALDTLMQARMHLASTGVLPDEPGSF